MIFAPAKKGSRGKMAIDRNLQSLQLVCVTLYSLTNKSETVLEFVSIYLCTFVVIMKLLVLHMILYCVGYRCAASQQVSSNFVNL